MSWPSPILADYRMTEPVEPHLERVTAAVREIQRILQGKVTLGGVTTDDKPNSDTSVVDLVLDQGTNNEINNPLDREPVGIIPLIAPGIVRPRWNMYTATVNVTNGSTTVTTTSTFSTDIALGYFVAQTDYVKILSRTNATTLELYNPWPGATAAGINASIMYRWDADTVWLYCGGTAGYPGLYRLMFF